jgi:terminase small subunit / prophage DNA-packing protein
MSKTEKRRRDLLGEDSAPRNRIEVGAPELASYLGITARTVTDHARTGVVIRLEPGVYDLLESVRSYCKHMRERMSSDELTQERIRQTREAADQLAIKNAKSKSELLSASAVEHEWAGILRDVRAGCLAIPTRVQQRLSNLSAEDVAAIDREVRDVLKNLGGENVDS